MEELCEKYIPFWHALDETERRKVVAATKRKTFRAGETLYVGGDDCTGAIFVVGGQLKVYMLSEEGRVVTLYHLREGDAEVLSASCVLGHIGFDVTVDAVSDCETLILCPKCFAALQSNPAVETYTYKLVAEKFSDVMWTLQQLLFTRLDRRLAAKLFDETAAKGTDRLRVTHEVLAQDLGTAREVVSRMLKTMEEEGVIALSRGIIEIKDAAALKHIVIKK